MVNPINVKQLDDFHANVEKLAEEQPISIFGRIYRRITNWSLTESNKANTVLMNLVAQQAANILKSDVNNLPNLDPIFQKKFQRFHKDMDKLFKKIYPLIEENPFSKNN